MGDCIVSVSGMNDPKSPSVQRDSLVSPLLSRTDEGNDTSPTSLLSRLREYLGRYITHLGRYIITFFASLSSRLIRVWTRYKKLQKEKNRNREQYRIVSNLAIGFAIYEKAATLCGNLVFIWATVVLLGGFATTLETLDFWVVTVLLMLAGVRIFCRSSEVTTFRGWAILGFFCIQVLSAMASIVISSHRLSIGFQDGESDINNRNTALRIFCYLCEIEAALILPQEFGWMIIFLIKSLFLLFRLVDAGTPGNFMLCWALVLYFYAIYCRCINESIFEGLKMELFPYIMDLLRSSDGDEKLAGAIAFVTVSDPYYREENQLIGTTGTRTDVLETLIDMLNWKSSREPAIRRAAAKIVSRLVKQNHNHIRMAAIPGSVKAILSLLYDSDPTVNLTVNNNVKNQSSQDDSDFFVLSKLGLKILISLAEDDANCAKIGSSRDLLPIMIRFTELNPRASASEIDKARLALELLKMLASSTHPRGEVLKKGISEIVTGISGLPDHLQYRKIPTYGFQNLAAIDKLTRLAVVEETRESIGNIDGVLPSLFSMLFNNESRDAETKKLVNKVGEALAQLSLENKQNCRRMMTIKLRNHPNLIAGLISALDHPVKGSHVATILRNLCAYTEAEYVELREIVATAAQVLKFVMEKKGRRQEAAIGLAAQIVEFKNKLDFDPVLTESDFEEWGGVTVISLIRELVAVFRRHPSPSEKVPNIRRFSMELLINVMKIDRTAIKMRSELVEPFVKTDLDDYSTFHGNAGLIAHRVPFHSLVLQLFSHLDDDGGISQIASLFDDQDDHL